MGHSIDIEDSDSDKDETQSSSFSSLSLLRPGPEHIRRRGFARRGVLSDAQKAIKANAGLRKEMRKLCTEAFDRGHKVGHGWSLRRAIEQRKLKDIETDTGTRLGWYEQTEPTLSSAFDEDYECVYICLPNAIKAKGLEAATKAALKLGRSFKLTRGVGSDHNVRDSPESYVYRTNQLSGTVILAYWKPQCHNHDPIAPSKNQLHTAYQFAAARDVIHDLDPIGVRVNAILEFIGKEAFEQCHQLRSEIIRKYSWAKDLLPNDCILMQGRSFAYNRQTRSHTDQNGPIGEWTPLIALGFSRGVKIRLAGIKEILCFEPGTIIFLRGGEIPHAIEAWSGGQRISVACFTHQNIWDEFGLEYPWSHPHTNLRILHPMP